MKSFRFANRFYNLLAGDSIEIYSSITWLSGGVNTVVEKDALNDAPAIVTLTSTDKIVTAAELVEIINQSINEIMLALHGNQAATTQLANFMNIFACGSFVFVTDSGKLALQMGPATNYTVKYGYPTAPTISAYGKFQAV